VQVLGCDWGITSATAVSLLCPPPTAELLTCHRAAQLSPAHPRPCAAAGLKRDFYGPRDLSLLAYLLLSLLAYVYRSLPLAVLVLNLNIVNLAICLRLKGQSLGACLNAPAGRWDACA